MSHRISSAKHADKIIVLDQGQIVANGTHQSLIKETGYYSELFKQQLLEKE